jgi:hypothetical protein
MAVSRAGVGYTQSYLLGGDADGSKSVSVNINPTAENTYGIVAYGIVGDSDIDGATLGVTWDGDAMTPLCDPLFFDTDNSVLRGWIIENPSSGNVVATYDDLPFGLLTKNLFLACVVVSSVEPLDLGTIEAAVVTAEGSGSVTTSGVTVASGVPADRVISAHLIGKLRAFSGYNGTRIAAPILAGGGQLLLGERRGEASTVATVTHNATSANWAAFGLNLNALPIEGFGFATSVVTIPQARFGADVYRATTPHPDRDYSVPGVGSADVNLIGGATTGSADGVNMPVWSKDPDDTLDYTLRWHNHMAPDDEIIAVSHTTTGSLRVFSESFSGDQTQVWLNGGTPGVTHEVRVRFTTARGRRHDRTFLIAGENN